jgi:hypothetical protein
MSDVESPVTSGCGRVDASRVALLLAWVVLIKRTQPLWTFWSRLLQILRVTELTRHRSLHPELSELKTNHEPYCEAYWYSKHYCNLERYCITYLHLLMLTVNLIASVEYVDE